MKTDGISTPKGHTRVQWAVTILSNMTLLTYGLQCGWMSPMTIVLQSDESPAGRPLTDKEIYWIASCPSLSGTVGVLLFVHLVDVYGRKMGIMAMNVFQALCWIITMFPPSTASLIIARLFCGLAGGGCFHVVPMYVKEIAQDNIRGTLASVLIFAQSAGILIMYAIGGYMEYYTVLWVVVGLPILTFGLFFKAPESPAFLVKKGKIEEATSTLAFLRGLDVDNKDIVNEIDAFKRDDAFYKSLPNISMITIFKDKGWRKAFIIMIIILTAYGTNGGFSIINYAATLLSDSGVNISPQLQSLSIPICMTVGALVTMATVDKIGRRPILAVSFGASAIAFTVMATSILNQQHGWTPPGWINIVMLMVIIYSYGGGVSPIPFIVMPEIFNFQIRAKLMGYLVMLAWFSSFIQLVAFGSLTSNFGAHVGFYMFTVINVLGAAVAVIVLPETKGKSIEEIETELRGEAKKKVTNGV